MRTLVAAALACAALAAGCSNPCQELGDRLCECRIEGTTKASCTDAVRAELERLHPGSNTKQACSDALDTCHAPGPINGVTVEFCDYIQGRCGKAACFMSEESIATLEKTLDPNNASADCQAATPPPRCMLCQP